MIQYSCDRCGCLIDAHQQVRYVVRLEVEVVFDANEEEHADIRSDDHLPEIEEILERAEAHADPNIGKRVYSRDRYDLCSTCHRKFVENPIGREIANPMNFSQN